jgi:DNA-binding PadR family transcriptional regulator
MRPPALTHSQFAILSALLDGRPRRGIEIARAIHFHRVNSVTIILRPLNWHGFIERVRWRESEEALVGYRITDSGRRAWLETADFYRHFVERFGKAQPPRSPPPAVTVIAPLGNSRRSNKAVG